MAYLLTNLLQDAYTNLGQLNASTATGGSTSTVVDSKQAGLHGDGTWKNGSAFIIRDAAGASAAPEGEFNLVTAYADSTGTFTATFTAAPAAGDTFAFVNDFYPLYTVIELCNMALQELGDIALVDVSLTTAANQTEYALPVACKGQRPLAVLIQGITTDANDNKYWNTVAFDYIPAAPGSTGLLVFETQPPASRTIKIVYMGRHPKLSVYSSIVSETIHPALASAAATEVCLRWQNSRLQGGDDFLLQRWNDAKTELMKAKADFPIWKPRKRTKLLILRSGFDPDQFSYPGPA